MKPFSISEIFLDLSLLETFFGIKDLTRLQKICFLLGFKNSLVSETFLGFKNLFRFQTPFSVLNTFFDFRNFTHVQKPLSPLKFLTSLRTFPGTQTSSKGNLIRFQRYFPISKTFFETSDLYGLRSPHRYSKTFLCFQNFSQFRNFSSI